MKHLTIAAALGLYAGGALAADAKAPAKPAEAKAENKVEEYVIDASHSKVGFEIGHLVVSTVEGNFRKFEGTYSVSDKLDKGLSAGYKATVSAAVDSIDTGVEKRDGHLKSPDFFDAKKFPDMKFVSTGVEVDGDKRMKLKGDLTIKDKTKPVTFDVVFKGPVVAYEKKRTAFKATTDISRKDFGLTWNDVVEAGPVVGDTVTISINVEGVRKSDMGAE